MLRPRELGATLQWFPTSTPTLPPATHTNSYALGSRQVLLVEPATPYEDEQRAFVEWARGLQSQGRELVGIFLTHHHLDHVGGLDAFARELALPVWAHRATADRVGLDRVQRFLHDGQQLSLDGPIPERWEVLHTPGHAPGHLCLWEPSHRVLVVGDMVASEGSILIAPGDGHMATYLDQLRRLAAFDASLALPAHGDPIEEPERLFRHYVTHRLLRERRVEDAVRAFGLTGGSAEDILRQAYADTPMHLWGLATLSLQSHLDKLVEEGTVEFDATRYVVRRDPGQLLRAKEHQKP